MKFLFVMDPVSSIVADEDTSYGLMHAAFRRGHEIDHCGVRDVFALGHVAMTNACRASFPDDAVPPVRLGAPYQIAIADYDAVFVRKDPPFDDEYLWLSLILDLASKETLIVNEPRGLRAANEKLYALNFPAVIPETIVSASAKDIRDFVGRVGGKGVIKPVDGHGGEGIFVLSEGDLNFNAHVETVTRNGSRLAMVQRYLPEVRQGDKRILLIEGEPLGAINRIPAVDDARSNIHVGGSVQAATLDAADLAIIEAVKPRLIEDGLHFVGLDVIGGRLTEVNVTSPTGIRQMAKFDGNDPAERVIEWAEDHRYH